MARAFKITILCYCITGGLWFTGCNNRPNKIDSTIIAQPAKNDSLVNTPPDTTDQGCYNALVAYYSQLQNTDTSHEYEISNEYEISRDNDSIQLYYWLTTTWHIAGDTLISSNDIGSFDTIYADDIIYTKTTYCQMVLDKTVIPAYAFEQTIADAPVYFTIIDGAGKYDYDDTLIRWECTRDAVYLLDQPDGRIVDTIFKDKVALKATGAYCERSQRTDEGFNHFPIIGNYVQVLYKGKFLWGMKNEKSTEQHYPGDYGIEGYFAKEDYVFYLVTKKDRKRLQSKDATFDWE